MERRQSGEIDTKPPSAVQNLRSRFEKLALKTTNYKQLDGNEYDLDASGPVSPRPRAFSNTTSGSFLEIRNPLRSSSSSSDLKELANRPPPPPPPPRGPKVSSGSPMTNSPHSPLVRPVPAPPPQNGSPHAHTPTIPPIDLMSTSMLEPSLFSSKDKPHAHIVSEPRRVTSWSIPASATDLPDFGPSVASLRNKFATATSYVKTHSTRLRDGNEVADIRSGKPAVPPRPPKVNDLPAGRIENLNDVAGAHSPNPTDDSEPAKYTRHPISRDPSIASSDSEGSLVPPKNSLPPRPPPRQRSAATNPPPSPSGALPRSSLPLVSAPAGPSTTSPSISSLAPPPLPVRRPVATPPEDTPVPNTPSLPPRPTIPFPAPAGLTESPTQSPTTDRRPFGASKLPPPPTRTIAIGDKLPPPRRPPSPSSDEDDDEEEDPRAQLADSLPDSSRSSRRPPVLAFREGYPEPRIQVHAFSGSVAISGTTAVAAHNHTIRIYNLSQSEVPVMTINPYNAIGLKDIKVTCMEFRPCASQVDRGYVLWVGTKEGHLFELDTRTGTVSGLRHSAHLHPTTHIFRFGRSMLTLDESGKALVFSPGKDGEDISMVFTQAKVVRVADRQDFAKVIGGKLWMAARADQQVVAVPGVKAPVVRVYDVFGTGNAVRNLMPMEHVGPVTSATIIPSQPGVVYVGHEEGFVTIWLLEAEDGFPRCLEVVKVSMSDVLCVEGVNDRLWAGGRNGMISAYDVTQKPWVVTNCWVAHPGLPVLKMVVDHYGIDMVGRLCVVSVGRDEQLRLWDGLLGVDWVEAELAKKEGTFSSARDLSMLLVSWNCDAARPEYLTGELANVNFLKDVLQSVESPDIISFGFQEVIDLESRKMAAKNVLLGSKKKVEDGGLSDKVTGAYKRWYDRLGQAVRQAMPPDVPYSVIHSESLVGLFTCVFVKHTERALLKDVNITTIKRGMGGMYGNKGGIVSRFVVDDSSICLVNCHLAAGQGAVRQRNADIAGMLEDKTAFPQTEYPFAYVGGGDGTMVLDHEIVFVSGDMNYRIDHRRDAIITAVRGHDLASLLSHDQLLREIKFNHACRLRGFSEGPLTFPPTYKYDRRSDEYDSSEKRRPPAWCDRVLWKSNVPSQVHQLHYQRYEANVSDHRPISAGFTVKVKSIKHDMRQRVKAEVQATWTKEQERLLSAAKQFYIKQALI